MEYVIVITLCDDKEVALKIIEKLLQKKLIAGSHMEEVMSTYFWKDEIVNSKEYKLKFRTRECLFSEIKATIKELHNYEVPEISMIKIADANEEFFNWISENTKKV